MIVVEDETFWVAELVDGLGNSFSPALYWNGHTRPVLEPVTTQDLDEAEKWRDEESCVRMIVRVSVVKRGVFQPKQIARTLCPHQNLEVVGSGGYWGCKDCGKEFYDEGFRNQMDELCRSLASLRQESERRLLEEFLAAR